jgi:hypothetical protein
VVAGKQGQSFGTDEHLAARVVLEGEGFTYRQIITKFLFICVTYFLTFL